MNSALDTINGLFSYEFDHVGIAVASLDESEAIYKTMGFKGGHTEEVPTERVRVRMFELENSSRIELLEPTSEDSPIAKFLKKRGPGIHHICLRVKDVKAILSKLKEAQVKLVHSEPVPGAHNCQVAFIHPSAMGGVLVELSQPGDQQ